MSDITISLATARAQHQAARDAYATVAHLLSVDQRRVFRVRLAQATAALRQAENAHWQKLFAADEELIIGLASHYYTSPAHVRAAADLAMVRASTHAPVIADAVVESIHQV